MSLDASTSSFVRTLASMATAAVPVPVPVLGPVRLPAPELPSTIALGFNTAIVGPAVVASTVAAVTNVAIAAAPTLVAEVAASVSAELGTSLPAATGAAATAAASASQLASAAAASLTASASGAAASAAGIDAVANAVVAAASPTKQHWREFTAEFIHAYEQNINQPSYRYAVYFWIIMAFLAISYAIAHHTKFSGGSIGAGFARWGIKRHTVRYGPKKSGRSFILPSNSYLTTMSLVMVIILLLCTVGPDHISMDEPFIGISFAKRQMDEVMREAYNLELKRPKHHDTINKQLWTAGNRFGFMAFAVMPLIVVMALKSAPFGFLTPRWFTALHWDKVGTFHRAGGWFVWWLVTLHAVLWAVQLFIWNYDGRVMFLCMTIAARFRCAVCSYIFMTIAMFTSLRHIRNLFYEWFYFGHVVCLFCAFVLATVHHHVVGYWMAICVFLWGGDRLTRMIRASYYGGKFGTGGPADFDAGEGLSSEVQHYIADAHKRSIEIPPGYAHAQLLPSKVVRLSIRTHRPMKWRPGQSLLLRLPGLPWYSVLQTHPFTIANNNPNEIVLLIKARKGITLRLYNEVLRLTAEAVQAVPAANKRKSIVPQAAPVHIRASVDGPMGSVGRVDWDEYTNVLMACGGSGVTFGMAVCEHLAKKMSSPGYTGKTQRVRFVWTVREYAEITWAASAMCRMLNYLDRDRLEINIYVTRAATSSRVARHRRKPSLTGSDSSGTTVVDDDDGDSRYGHDSMEVLESALPSSCLDPELGVDDDEDDIRGLTHYYGEEDNDDPSDRRMSLFLQREGGKRRRASRMLLAQGRPSTNKYNAGPSEGLMSPTACAPDNYYDVSLESGAAPSDGVVHPHFHGSTAPLSVAHARTESGSSYSQPSNPYIDEEGKENYHKAFTTRTHQMVLMDNTPGFAGGKNGSGGCANCGECEGAKLWIDQGDYTAAQHMSEYARTGRAPMDKIVREEMAIATGRTIISTCGPVSLNSQLRNLVSENIDMVKLRKGDHTGFVTMYSEDFEM